MRYRLPFIAVTLLALACASGVGHAQAKQGKPDSALVPVLNKESGKLEAFLLLEPTTTTAGTRWRFGSTTLEATYGLQTGDSLALLCDRRNGIGSEIVQLANSCVLALASLDGNHPGTGSRNGTAGASISRNGTKVGVAVGSGRDTLPVWLAPNKVAKKVEQNDFSLFAEKNIGRDSFVSVGGTLARVRLVPAADLPLLADQWNTRSLSIGAGYGSLGANIVGRVVNVPGESNVWKGLGLGLTWRTPWSGQLSVGADNVVTRGKNPFSATNGQEDDGTVPYVRYQQDL